MCLETRNHILLWSSTHIKAILMKIIFNSEKSGPAKTGLAGLVATALLYDMCRTGKGLGRMGADPERGSEYRGVSLMLGGTAPRSYRVFCFYNTMSNARFRAYLSKYKEVFSQIWSRGCGGCNPMENIGCFII